jgi:hypothetical protein
MYFANSLELYRFLQEAARTHTSIQPAKYPQSVTVGSTFQVEGDGWLTDKVTVNLKKEDKVLWSGDAVPDHGHFSMQAKCPADTEPGDYTLEYTSADWGMGSFGINIYKPV